MSKLAVSHKWSTVALGDRCFGCGLSPLSSRRSFLSRRPHSLFYFCNRPVSGWVIFTQWMELRGRTAQFPFSLAITKLFIDVLHLPPTAFMIRLPNAAVFGILTVLGMYMLGRQMAGRATVVLFVEEPSYYEGLQRQFVKL